MFSPTEVTAQLELISKATPTTPCDSTALHAVVVTTSPSRYEVSYTAISRGQHKLHVRLNDREINGSPFTMTVYPDPTWLADPVKIIWRWYHPYGIAVDSHGEVIASEHLWHQVAILEVSGKMFRFGSRIHIDPDELMEYPSGLAIDTTENVYVDSLYKLQKWTRSGELVKFVGSDVHGSDVHGSEEVEV